MAPIPPPPPPGARPTADLLVGSRFEAQFLGAGGANPLDIYFRRISGLSATVETFSLGEGGENGFTRQLPRRISRSNLVLERGVVVRSPLAADIGLAMERFKFKPGNLLIKVLGATGRPAAIWMFNKAYPVRWSLADLDAGEDQVLIETVEVAYTLMRKLDP